MNEAQLQEAVIECAQVLRWRVAHFRAAKTDKGWRTPVSADGAGFPDLVLVRDGRLIFAELKGDGGNTRPSQQTWLYTLEQTAAEVYVWKPADWTSGRIEAALRGS